MIHGKTKIELYNPNTKIKKVFKDENTFQPNTLAKFMSSNGQANNSSWGVSDFANNYWQSLVGGLFLFKNAIDISGGEVPFMPAGNKMVGCGVCGLQNSDYPNEMGTYNSQESSTGVSAITQVYDFETHQANGTIGCLSLTSQVGARIGYGFEQGRKGTYQLSERQTSRGICSWEQAVYNNKKYWASINADGNVVLNWNRIGLTQESIFDSLFSGSKTYEMASNPYSSMGASGKPLSLFMTETAGVFRATPQIEYYSSLSSRFNVPSGSTLYYYEIDVVNDTCTIKSLTNSSSKTLVPTRYGYGNDYPCMFAGNYLVMRTTDNRYAIFDLTNNTLLRADISGAYENFLNDGDHIVGYLGGDLILLSLSSGTCIYDAVADTVKPIGFTSYLGTRIPNTDLIARFNGGGLYHNPLYLATINNLQSPVTKTAAQTMKVTYTLTEA